MTVPMVPALKTFSSPKRRPVSRWAWDWYSPEKLRSISGVLSPLKPMNVAKGISKPETPSAWMQLFINADGDVKNGWHGYDYIVNYSAASERVSNIVKCTVNADGVLETEQVGEISYRVEDNKMMLAVPMQYFGGDYEKIYLEFKWADADEGIEFKALEDFYTYGDVAPLGRLNWIYQNYIPE